jgi:hypothetical protein
MPSQRCAQGTGDVGAVAIVFIFWGIWTPREARERDLVKIWDQTITIAEASKYYQNMKERYQSVYGDRLTEEVAKRLGLKSKTTCLSSPGFAKPANKKRQHRILANIHN